MILFEIYLSITLIMTPIDESWNYLHPHPFRMKEYILLNWHRNDFHFWIDGSWILKRKNENDSKLKAKARRHWHEHKAKQIR